MHVRNPSAASGQRGAQMHQKRPITFLAAFLLSVVLAGHSGEAACARIGPPQARISACSQTLAAKPPKSELPALLTIRGEAYARKGMLKEAISDFDAALRTKPRHLPALRGRGMANLAARDFKAGIADLSAALKIDPNDTSALVARGYAYIVKAKPQEAVRDFDHALTLEPDNAIALNNRGLAKRKLGQLQSALDDFAKATQLQPLYALAYNNRGYVNEALGNKKAAIEDFERALTIDPSLVGARDGLRRLTAKSSAAEKSTQLIAAGRSIATKNCAWCHAVGLKGSSPNASAPPFRDIHRRHPILALRAPISRAIVTPHDDMPKLSLSVTQIDQLIAYISSLRPAR